jgi:choline kinase
VGSQGDQIVARIGARVATRHNPEFRTMGSVHSLQIAADRLRGDVVILNSDVVFPAGMLRELRSLDEPSTLVVHPRQRYTARIGTLVSAGALLDVGRHIPSDSCPAVFSGIARVRADAINPFREAVLRCDPHLTGVGWSAAFVSMIRAGHRVRAWTYDGPVFDVNSVASYSAARAYVADENSVAPLSH